MSRMTKNQVYSLFLLLYILTPPGAKKGLVSETDVQDPFFAPPPRKIAVWPRKVIMAISHIPGQSCVARPLFSHPNTKEKSSLTMRD